MSIINSENTRILNNTYEKFCNSIKFREGEDFYTENPVIYELSYNENPLGPGTLAKDVIRNHINFVHRYPPLGYSLLIDGLAKHLSIKPENFIITAGSVAAINLAIHQFTDPGDKVIYSKSSMPWYRWSVIGCNAIPVEIPLKKNMHHDLDCILKSIDSKTKVIILSNPHNPTGLYIQENELLSFYKRLPQNVLLLIDQAYYEYQTNQENKLIEILNDAPNLMLTRTFSKIHGLAGLRVGYGMSTEKNIQALKAKWLGSFPTITAISSYAATHALSDKEHLEKSYKFNQEIKDFIYKIADEYEIKYVKSEANFVLINIFDSIKNEKFFTNQNMALTCGYFFGYPEWVRLSFDKRKSDFLMKLTDIFKLEDLRK